MAGKREFDPQRFEELVLYIAWKTRDDPDFGRTKLAKVLFYTDFLYYASEGQSLTGATYHAEEHGPFPRYLTTAEEHLVENQLAKADRIELRERGEYDKNRIIPFEEPVTQLGPFALGLADACLLDIAAIRTANAISDYTHDLPGWLLARPDEEAIPYETVFVGTEQPPDQAVERGRELIRAFKWE